jgi:hypothetical protein
LRTLGTRDLEKIESGNSILVGILYCFLNFVLFLKIFNKTYFDMVLESHDFKNYLKDVTDTLLSKDLAYLKRSLMLDPNSVEKVNIIVAFENFLAVLIGDTTVIGKFQEKEKVREDFRKMYGEKPMPKKDAIKYSGWSKASFERKVTKKDKIMINGKPYFKIDNLDKIMKAINLESNKLVICLENSIYVDKETREIVPFEKDKIYKIINENKIWITLFNAKLEQTARFSAKKFRKFFRNAEDWEIDQIKFNLNDLS